MFCLLPLMASLVAVVSGCWVIEGHLRLGQQQYHATQAPHRPTHIEQCYRRVAAAPDAQGCNFFIFNNTMSPAAVGPCDSPAE